MTTNEFAECILQTRKSQPPEVRDEAAAYDAAQIVSGSFTYPLYGALWQNGFDMDAVTEHLEALYDSGNHLGMLYFIFILSDAVDFVLPLPFSEMSANDALAPVLAAAIIEDWLEYDVTSGVEVIES